MYRYYLITLCTFGALMDFMSTFAQAPDRSRAVINKLITATNEISFNVDGRNTAVKYSDISGSPFWDLEYRVATFFKDQVKIGTAPAKLNLLSNEIYFRIENEELVLDEQSINKILFQSKEDTITFVRMVPNLFLNKKKVDDFVQELNGGQYKLLKYTKKELASADSGLTSKKYFFQETHYYFLKNLQRVERIPKLKDQNVLAYLPGANRLREWAKQNRIDFRKEEDIVSFLNHYNSILEKKN